MKIFDVAVAMQIAYSITSTSTSTYKPQNKFYFDGKQGISLCSSETDKVKVINDYLNNLASKLHVKTAGVINAEKKYLTETSININSFDCHYIKETYETLKRNFGVIDYKLKLNKNAPINVKPLTLPKTIKPDTSGFYDLSGKTIYIYSDEEGGAPFKNNNPFSEEHITIGEKQIGETKIKTGLIKEVTENAALIFLGDVQDNSKHNIETMLNFIKIKENELNNVILIGGNRDFNKVRFVDEYYMLYNGKPATLVDWAKELKKPTQNSVKKPDFTHVVHYIIANVKNYTFAFNRDKLGPDMNIKPWHKMALVNFDKDLITRVNRTYLDTFTAYNYYPDPDLKDNKYNEDNPPLITTENYITQELIKLGLYTAKIPQQLEKLEIAVVTSLFNMVASRNWKNQQKNQLSLTFTFGSDETDNKLNNLYMNYLSKCDINAIFKAGDNYGYVSHAGLSHFDSHITNRLGYALQSTKRYNKNTQNADKASEPTDVSLFEIVKEYKDFMNKLNTIITKEEPAYTNDFEPTLKRGKNLVKHIISMSTPSQYRINKNNDVYMHMMSPIVSTCGPHTPDMPAHKQMFDQHAIIPLYYNSKSSTGGSHQEYLNNIYYNTKIQGVQENNTIVAPFKKASTRHSNNTNKPIPIFSNIDFDNINTNNTIRTL
jgi:hypothetical protein